MNTLAALFSNMLSLSQCPHFRLSVIQQETEQFLACAEATFGHAGVFIFSFDCRATPIFLQREKRARTRKKKLHTSFRRTDTLLRFEMRDGISPLSFSAQKPPLRKRNSSGSRSEPPSLKGSSRRNSISLSSVSSSMSPPRHSSDSEDFGATNWTTLEPRLIADVLLYGHDGSDMRVTRLLNCAELQIHGLNVDDPVPLYSHGLWLFRAPSGDESVRIVESDHTTLTVEWAEKDERLLVTRVEVKFEQHEAMIEWVNKSGLLEER